MELVFKSNDQAVTTSRLVAERFGKRHADIIRRLENLECSTDFTERNFALSAYKDATGRKCKEYQITRDGFSFLVMGFTGKDAAKFKEQYIKAFNLMEQQANRPMTQAEMMLAQAQLIVQLDNTQREHDARLRVLEAKSVVDFEHYSVMAYAVINNVSVSRNKAATVGRKCASICKTRGIEVEKIQDPRYGHVGAYPLDVLKEVFTHYGIVKASA